ncbi:hypothetical protein [Salinisphaera orenii]|uniref:Uncharacterized protein n=1 Tax=Salinisphaera orenii YIM 95161 TaxID=1051139 RepID=A0A423QBF3_9GAMM|nr:hypothetical protein [Salinisphaera halophila]ROO37809.1 hypothetical protein SAHL_00935 [Salinisphaera halophila YIM 95161]
MVLTFAASLAGVGRAMPGTPRMKGRLLRSGSAAAHDQRRHHPVVFVRLQRQRLRRVLPHQLAIVGRAIQGLDDRGDHALSHGPGTPLTLSDARYRRTVWRLLRR